MCRWSKFCRNVMCWCCRINLCRWSRLYFILVCKTVLRQMPTIIWAVDNEKKKHLDFWMIFDKVIVQPPLCSGERGIVCPAYNVPFLVAYCLLPAFCCCYTAVQCTMHTQCPFSWICVRFYSRKLERNLQKLTSCYGMKSRFWFLVQRKNGNYYNLQLSWYLFEEHPACSLFGVLILL